MKSLVVLCASLSLVGCKASASYGLDTGQAEQVIKDGLKAQAGEAPKSMTCPTSVAMKPGTTFECKGETPDGRALVVSVTVKDGAGNISWKLNSVGSHPAPAGDEHAKDEPKPEDDKPAQ
jgi:hypothetical protein